MGGDATILFGLVGFVVRDMLVMRGWIVDGWIHGINTIGLEECSVCGFIFQWRQSGETGRRETSNTSLAT